MTPNQVTAMRVAAAFAAVGLFTFFGRVLAADFAAVALTIAAIALDGVDGYLARTRGMATPLGAQLDILGDRVVENLFFTFFAVAGLISLWLPILFFVRGTVIDFLRGLAGARGAERIRESFDAGNVVGSGASDFAGESRGVCDFEVRVFLLSGIAGAGRALARELVGRERAFFAFAGGANSGWYCGGFLHRARGAGGVGGATLSCGGRAETSCAKCCGDPRDTMTGAVLQSETAGAFFDVDGTLLPAPPLEWRFIGYLLERDEISSGHVGRWLARFAGGFWRDLHGATEGNKRLSLRNQRRAGERLGKIAGRRIFCRAFTGIFRRSAAADCVAPGAGTSCVYCVWHFGALGACGGAQSCRACCDGCGGVRD